MVGIETVIQGITYGCVALGFAAVFAYLEPYHMLGFLCLALFALFCEHRRVVEIPRWLLNGIALGILSLAFFRITPEYLIEPILDALMILAAVKLLEDKTPRDTMQIYLICLFLLVGSTLISLSISFLLYLSLFLMLTTTALILLAYFAHDPQMTITKTNLGKILLQSTLIFVLSLPLSMLLFVILPRTAYPFLNFLNKPGEARSGFADTISLGQVAAIQEDNAVIFRCEMEQLEESRLFWRGLVLDQFDGTKWTSTLAADKEELADFEGVQAQSVSQTIYLEPYGNKYLFALDKPMVFSVHRNKYSKIPIIPFRTKVLERIRYTAISNTVGRFPETAIDREHYLALPEGYSPELKNLVQSLVAQKPQDEQIKTLFSFLHGGAYTYSLDNLPVSEAPLEAFLFVNKRGNCEYFASSLAVMLRIAGIPARLIGGYKGGHYNNAGQYYLVTQRNAHVWVEAYLPDLGWLRLDPTPPVSALSSLGVVSRAFLQLQLLLDTFNYYWYKVIIDYDFARQLGMLSALRERLARPGMKFGLNQSVIRNTFLVSGFLIVAFFLIWVLAIKHRKREERIISRFLHRMAAHGYEKERHEGLEEFIRRISRDDLRDQARGFVEDFEQVYYRDGEFTRETLQRLRSHLKGL